MKRSQFLPLMAALGALLPLTAHPAAPQQEKATAQVSIAQFEHLFVT